MDPLWLLVPFLGVLLVIGMVYLLWGRAVASLPGEDAIKELILQEFPNAHVETWLMDTARRYALATDVEGSKLWVLYPHGNFINVRAFTRRDLRDITWTTRGDGSLALTLRTRDFDRGQFVLVFSGDDEEKQHAQAWLARFEQQMEKA